MTEESSLGLHVKLAAFMTDSAFSWRRLAYATILGLASNASLWTSVTLMPSLQAHFDLSRTNASWPYIMIITGFLISTPILGKLSDRYGIAVVLVGASILSGGSYIAGALAPNFAIYLMTQLGVGMGTAVGFAPLIADTSHWFRRHRGLAIAIVSCSAYLSGIISSILIDRILSEGSWQQVNYTIGCILLAIIPAAFLLRKRVPEHILNEADKLSILQVQNIALTPKKIKWILVLAGVSCCVAMAMPQVHIVSLCIDLGFTISQGSDLLTIILIGGLVSRLICGALTDKIGPVRILLVGSILQTIALLLYISFDGFISLYIVSLIFGLSQGGILPSYPMIVRQYLPARSAGAAIGLVSTATQLGMALGGWMSGWIYDMTGSYFYAFFNGIVWNVFNFALIFYLSLNAKGSPSPVQKSQNNTRAEGLV